MSATWTHTRGGWAVEIRITHVMSFEDLINALLWDYRYHNFGGGTPADLGVGKVREKVRDSLREAGIDTVAAWSNDVHERDLRPAVEWAGRMIAAAYGAPPADGGRR